MINSQSKNKEKTPAYEGAVGRKYHTKIRGNEMHKK
jgi:hypothetical protein